MQNALRLNKQNRERDEMCFVHTRALFYSPAYAHKQADMLIKD